MPNTARVYDLSFVFLNKERLTKPKIVFTLKHDHYRLLLDRLEILKKRGLVEASLYLGRDMSFSLPYDNLVSQFGFGHCGSVEDTDGEVRLAFELSGGLHAHCIALSIHVLTMSLSFPLVEGEVSNQAQQLDLETFCSTEATHGHSVSGNVRPALAQFLLRYAEKEQEKNGVLMPDRVIAAMQQTWSVLSPKSGYSRDSFYGQITKDGRFMLGCPGNACDVAIYPDMVHGDIGEYGAGLSCHNLDTVAQQLTLLAGLAALCEFARECTT